MNQPIHGENINKVLLKPRFKIKLNESKDEIIHTFEQCIASKECKFITKQSNGHFFLDVPKEEEHFWSPQLQIEVIEDNEENKTIVKGILGPKPQVWTLFMFLHFIIALTFVVFFVMFYVKWSMDKEYQFYKYMLITLPLIWVAMYFIGQLGKKIAYNQMLALDNFLNKTLEKVRRQNDITIERTTSTGGSMTVSVSRGT